MLSFVQISFKLQTRMLIVHPNFADTSSRLFSDILPSAAAVVFINSVLESNFCLHSSWKHSEMTGHEVWTVGCVFYWCPPMSANTNITTCVVCGHALSWSKHHNFINNFVFFFVFSPWIAFCKTDFSVFVQYSPITVCIWGTQCWRIMCLDSKNSFQMKVPWKMYLVEVGFCVFKHLIAVGS